MQPIVNCLPRRAIIHVLDNSANALITSDYELDITFDVEEYLKKHIMRTLHDDRSRVARFQAAETNIVRNACQAIFRDPAQFVPQSKVIAQHLFTVMSANKSISSADLLVCLYEGDEQPYLAILKLDYNDTYIHDFAAATEHDAIKLVLKKGTNSLPHPNQKLQKAVFVQPEQRSAAFDFVVLDKQSNAKDTEEDIAHYFFKLFLNALMVVRDRDKTAEFIDLTRKWIDQAIEPNEAIQLVSIIGNNLIREEPVEARELSNNMFGPASPLRARKTEYESYLTEQGFADQDFSVDPEVAQKQLKRLKWITEEGIEIIIKNPAHADKVSIATDQAGNSSVIIKNVNIKP